MLTYNITPLFQKRNIKYRAKHLMQHGISYNLANRIVTGQLDKISLDVLERLCQALNCTPNDIYNYTPNTEADKNEQNALLKLVKENTDTDNLSKMLRDLPLDKLKEIEEVLRKTGNSQ